MSPSFWHSKNKHFLIFKPAQGLPFEEKRVSLLRDAPNIYINGTSLYELLIYHVGINPEVLSKEAIDKYLKENMHYATLSAIFQGFLFYNTAEELKPVYAEKISYLLFQEGLMFSAAHVLPRLSETFAKEGCLITTEDIEATVYLVTTEQGNILVHESCQLKKAKSLVGEHQILSKEESSLITIENHFQLSPSLDDAQKGVHCESIDCTIVIHEPLIVASLNKCTVLEKIKHFIETTLEANPLESAARIAAKS